MKISYTPKGVCSRQINIEVEDGIVQNVEYIGGCNGNLKGIGSVSYTHLTLPTNSRV